MSTLRVATIETENELTDLTIKTGNTSGPSITIYAGNNDIQIDGDVTATDFITASDIKLKENIQSLNNSIDIINQINPVSFDWKNTGEKSYGVIAQEIEKVLPDIVSSKGENKSVAYIQLIALLIDSIKELDKEIKILKLKNDKFEKQLNNLNI